jgi:hypothetical protein
VPALPFLSPDKPQPNDENDEHVPGDQFAEQQQIEGALLTFTEG